MNLQLKQNMQQALSRRRRLKRATVTDGFCGPGSRRQDPGDRNPSGINKPVRIYPAYMIGRCKKTFLTMEE